MRKRRFTEEQVIGVLKEAEGGIAVTELCRQHGICEQTDYRWKSKYGGLGVSEARGLRQLEEENRRRQADDGQASTGHPSVERSAGKKVLTPTGGREAVGVMKEVYRRSERRACQLLGLRRSSCRYQPRRGEEKAWRERLRELAAERRRFGYRRLAVLLRREGWAVNWKRVYRVCRQEHLQVGKRLRKRGVSQQRLPLAVPGGPNERWSMDFMMDSLATG